VTTARSHKTKPVRKRAQLFVREDGSLRLAVLADTHSTPHPRTLEVLAALRPDAILHAGDVGDPRVLEELASLCPVLAVRGNIDVRHPDLPDELVIEIGTADQVVLRVLLLHVGVYGPKLRAEVVRSARAEAASLVVCGHSHVPFIGTDHGLMLLNPGSIGPRRFGLPIVFGRLDVRGSDVQLGHVDCETGQQWLPPSLRRSD
jgi:uncharacterized protein